MPTSTANPTQATAPRDHDTAPRASEPRAGAARSDAPPAPTLSERAALAIMAKGFQIRACPTRGNRNPQFFLSGIGKISRGAVQRLDRQGRIALTSSGTYAITASGRAILIAAAPPAPSYSFNRAQQVPA